MNNDLISRNDLKEKLNEIFDTVEVVLFDDVISIIDNAPTVEPKQGEWDKIGEIGLAYKCNKCGEVSVIPTRFCPNCGADMRKGGAE